MIDSAASRSWLTFAGCVLVVAVLYWAQTVLVPIALALLVTFVLTTPVTWLQRRIGRVPAVLVVIALVVAGLGLASWALWHQIENLAEDLPSYRSNIRQKVADIRGAGKDSSVEKIKDTIDDIRAEIDASEARPGTDRRPVVVESQQVTTLWDFPPGSVPIIAPASTAGLIVVFVLFMLLEREALRDRLISVVGHGHLTVTTRAFDEAGRGVSRQLMMQSLVNAIVGIVAVLGLYWIGVPYALLWGIAAAALRFVPYFGPLVAAGAPILISLAAAPGWTQPLLVAGFFIALELFTNLVLETVLYAGAAGVSQVGLLVAVAFWTWLWGLPGLLMAMPLTVCLAVLGKHVRGLEFMATLLADTASLSPELGYYQRLLARDLGEAADLLERHVKTESSDTVYDALLLPALNYAERDRLEERLSPEEEAAVVDATRDLMADLGGAPSEASPGTSDAPRSAFEIIAVPANGAADDLALRMLGQLLTGAHVALDVLRPQLMSSEIVSLVKQSGCRVVCIADLPPSAPSKTRYLIKKLRAVLPDVQILVGRWAPPAMGDEDQAALRDTGANHVASSLLETRDRIVELAVALRPPAPEPEAALIAG